MHFEKKIGIIGGGQLGKMMILPANLLGFKTVVFTDEPESPATVFANEVVVGSYSDSTKIEEFNSKSDFVTIEFEGIGASILKNFESKLNPNINAVFTSQNRLREKNFFKEASIETAEFSEIKSKEKAIDFFQKNGKFILKTTENGYDGKGQFVISNLKDITPEIPFEKTELIAEKFIPFAFEASVILTREKGGKIQVFPIPVNIHREGILHKSIIRFEETPWKERMQKMACTIASKLEFVGTMAVEFFVLGDGKILANEMAPRPHNSGHFSIDLCNVCQFANHIRAITGLPTIPPKLLFEGEMLNLIGEEINLSTKFLDKPNAKLHIYGKGEPKPKRKMGHINFIYDEIFS